MGVQYDRARERFVVRWRENGKKRCRRFMTEEEAEAFDASLVRARGRPSEPVPPTLGGPPASRRGDGSVSSRRGFTSRQAAATARRKLLEAIDRREVKPARETFESSWTKLLAEKRPYMSAGAMQDFEAHGRKRLLPLFFRAQARGHRR